ncbi:tumor necrosis factor receptor superfamily member 16 isoform X3 [Buteo buteo]|uniref:tumor necrosis factor receptor superfamily member 16 isoform X3 n=1 Tax=Buteo buteo TaxID=30397 RepID=UPI003EC0E4BE
MSTPRVGPYLDAMHFSACPCREGPVTRVTSWLCFLSQGPTWASKEKCFTKMYTTSGECCKACNLGEGVVQPCGVNQTVCEPCLDSVTYSDTDSQDTVCEECPEGTFSSEANFVDPCLPCTTCEENEVMVKECTAISDAECRDLHPRWTTQMPSLVGSDSPEPITRDPFNTEVMPSTLADTVTTIMGSSQPVVSRGTADNLIPVYCSILAAVVVGLVAYIAFKRWNNCKQNKQGANNRPVNQTPSPEGEKLHSDSGISVDSQSLHDQQPPSQSTQGPAPKGDGNLYANLPPSKQEEVEKLLGSSAEETWRQLAGELGYKEDLIDSFTREESPARALLADWSSKETATLDVLLAALHKIQRGDIAESLYSESTATSPV